MQDPLQFNISREKYIPWSCPHFQFMNINWKGSLVLPSSCVICPSFIHHPLLLNLHTSSSLSLNWSPFFSSVAQLCPILCNPMNCSTPGLPVHHQLLEFTQTHVHRVDDAIQPSHPLSSPSPPAPNPFHHQSLFQWVNSSEKVAKVLEFQLQHQSFQWTPRTDLL